MAPFPALLPTTNKSVTGLLLVFVEVVEDVQADPQRVDLVPQPQEALVDLALQVRGDALLRVVDGLDGAANLANLPLVGGVPSAASGR